MRRVYQDMLEKGFQGVRADVIVRDHLPFTKGALYYHFETKKDLGCAIVEEIIQPNYLEPYIPLISHTGNPIDYLQNILSEIKSSATEDVLRIGSPVHNLVQEMSPIDEEFRTRLEIILDTMRAIVADAFQRGQTNGWVKQTLSPRQVASFFQAALGGTYSLAKASRNKMGFEANIDLLSNYLESLRT